MFLESVDFNGEQVQGFEQAARQGDQSCDLLADGDGAGRDSSGKVLQQPLVPLERVAKAFIQSGLNLAVHARRVAEATGADVLPPISSGLAMSVAHTEAMLLASSIEREVRRIGVRLIELPFELLDRLETPTSDVGELRACLAALREAAISN